MPIAELSDVRLHYEMSGSAGNPTLVLAHALGANLAMWRPQMHEWEEHFHVVRYDTRGHGKSDVTPGPYSMDMFGRDAVGLMDCLEIESAHYCGLSLSGMTAMWLGMNAPHRVKKLVIANASAYLPPRETWNDRADNVRKYGMEAVIPGALERWFTAKFRQENPEVIEEVRTMLEHMPAEGYAAGCAAVRDMDFREGLRKITAAVLVIAGAQDTGSTPGACRVVADSVQHGKYLELAAAHCSNFEQPEKFAAAVVKFCGEAE